MKLSFAETDSSPYDNEEGFKTQILKSYKGINKIKKIPFKCVYYVNDLLIYSRNIIKNKK